MKRAMLGALDALDSGRESQDRARNHAGRVAGVVRVFGALGVWGVVVVGVFANGGSSRASEPGSGNVSIRTLRRQLDPTSRALTNRTGIFEVVGRVNPPGEVGVAPDGFFFLEDESGGVGVRWVGNHGKAPMAGATVRARGVLSQARGLLQLNVDPGNARHDLKVESLEGEPRTPQLLSGADVVSSEQLEAMEGRWVKLNRVRFSTGGTLRESVNQPLVFENGDASIPVRISPLASEWVGVAKPAGVVSVEGVLSQSDTSSPFDTGYFVWLTRSAGMAVEKPGPQWSVSHHVEGRVRDERVPLGAGAEQVVRVGESLRSEFELTEDGGGEALRLLMAAPTAWPPGVRAPFEVENRTDANGVTSRRIRMELAWTAGTADSGRLVLFALAGANDVSTNVLKFSAYVPAPGERGIRVTEFLANPSANSTAKTWNPLRRLVPAGARASEWDEFVEIANLGRELVDLSEWTLADGAEVRHRFRDGMMLGPGEAWVVYGGTSDESPVEAGIRGEAASEGGGLGLNNGGDTLELRNGDGNLVLRVGYTGQQLSADASVVPGAGLETWGIHSDEAGNRVSPGELAGLEPSVLTSSGLFDPQPIERPPAVALSRDEVSWAWVLRFPEWKGRRVRVWGAEALGVGFRSLAEDVIDGRWTVANLEGAGGSGRYFWVELAP